MQPTITNNIEDLAQAVSSCLLNNPVFVSAVADKITAQGTDTGLGTPQKTEKKSRWWKYLPLSMLFTAITSGSLMGLSHLGMNAVRKGTQYMLPQNEVQQQVVRAGLNRAGELFKNPWISTLSPIIDTQIMRCGDKLLDLNSEKNKLNKQLAIPNTPHEQHSAIQANLKEIDKQIAKYNDRLLLFRGVQDIKDKLDIGRQMQQDGWIDPYEEIAENNNTEVR